MLKFRVAAATAAICLAAVLTCCGKDDKESSAQAGVTSDRGSAEYADADLETDSEEEETQQEEEQASTDLFFEDGAVCTQFFRLTPPEEWESGVSYHYFQEPEDGRFALDIVEDNSMIATEGVGGFLYSIALYETYPEERGLENSGYVGMLKSEEAPFYYVFLEYPDSAQYTEGSKEAYQRAEETGNSIAGYIEGRNGYTFEAGKEPEGVQEQE